MEYNDVAKIYKETSVKTADGGKLIVLLYEEILKHIGEAKNIMIEEKHRGYDRVNFHITRAQEIIMELATALDQSYDKKFYDQLLSLYLYFNRQLNEANIKKDVALLSPIYAMIADLLESWRKIKHVSAHSTQKTLGVNLSG